eukprot:358296-Chlamydomonas_euryale.AAC.9
MLTSSQPVSLVAGRYGLAREPKHDAGRRPGLDISKLMQMLNTEHDSAHVEEGLSGIYIVHLDAHAFQPPHVNPFEQAETLELIYVEAPCPVQWTDRYHTWYA